MIVITLGIVIMNIQNQTKKDFIKWQINESCKPESMLEESKEDYYKNFKFMVIERITV